MNQSQERWWKNDPNVSKDAIGVILHKIEGQWTVARTLLGSPAEKAGIEKGDILLAFAGNSLSSSLGEAEIERTLSFLAEGDEVEVSLERSQNSHLLLVSFESLSNLLELDYKLGGAVLRYCKSCKYCQDTSSGVADCKGDGGKCDTKCTIG